MRDRQSDVHRKIAAAKLGRKLKPHEVVDHEDMDKTNNSPRNLRVMTRKEHSAMHEDPKRKHTERLKRALNVGRKGNRKLF